MSYLSNFKDAMWIFKCKYLQKKASTAQNMKFSINDFFSKCDRIRSFLQIWSHLLKKSLMENFIFVQWSLLGEKKLQIRYRRLSFGKKKFFMTSFLKENE